MEVCRVAVVNPADVLLPAFVGIELMNSITSMSHEAGLDRDKLCRLYKQARNRLWKRSPASVLNIATELLHSAANGGVEVMRKYQPWNLLLLVRWTFERFDPVAHRRRDATLEDIHLVLNLIHEMEEHVRMPNEYEHLSLYLRHLAFQQFWLQHPADAFSLARQELLFSRLPKEHRFQKEFLRLTGVCCEEFISLSLSVMLLYQGSQSRYSLNQSAFQSFGSRFSPESTHAFLDSLSLDLAEAHQMFTIGNSKGMHVWDQMLFPSPLRDFPLLRRGGDYVVYSPKLLFRALEDCIYRRLKREDKEDFCSKFGNIFERYLGDRISEAGVTYLNEQTLNSALTGTGKCVDFLVAEDGYNILIEAKGVEISRACLQNQKVSQSKMAAR